MNIRPGDSLTAGQVAKIFGVTTRTVYRWRREGILPDSFRTPGGHSRYLGSDILRYFDNIKKEQER